MNETDSFWTKLKEIDSTVVETGDKKSHSGNLDDVRALYIDFLQYCKGLLSDGTDIYSAQSTEAMLNSKLELGFRSWFLTTLIRKTIKAYRGEIDDMRKTMTSQGDMIYSLRGELKEMLDRAEYAENAAVELKQQHERELEELGYGAE